MDTLSLSDGHRVVHHPVVRVALPVPVRRLFDYRSPVDLLHPLCPGVRVRVPLGRRQAIGLIIAHGVRTSIEATRLKSILEVLDETPVIDEPLLTLLGWASRYYHHPIGEVIDTALPTWVRQGKPNRPTSQSIWYVVNPGADGLATLARHAPRQAEVLKYLTAHPQGLDAAHLQANVPSWRPAVKALVEKGLVASARTSHRPADNPQPSVPPLTLNSDQQAAVTAISQSLGTFRTFVLDGVTGSGKTEVYFAVMERVLAACAQVLVLVPEIGLTPHLTERIRARFGDSLAVLHSGLSDTVRYCAWYSARTGQSAIILGTRLAVFTPLARPGLIIVDEEHDLSYKQQEGFRYHARDIAVKRAAQYGIPVVLGSATPSLESLCNVKQRKYCRLCLPKRPGLACSPRLEVIDLRHQRLRHGLADDLITAVRTHLGAGNQVLLFLNRRGYAPVLLCHDCGWVAGCQYCDAHLTYHAQAQRLRCHHCGAVHGVPKGCPQCRDATLVTVGAGTQRVQQALETLFPTTPMIRIDRDAMRRKGALAQSLTDIHNERYQLLIGTQMLSKGHDFPGVTLVGIIDADQGLYSIDFRAQERMAQLIVQVAGRAGRAERPGTVLLQTHCPDHLLLKTLLTQGYGAFVQAALRERASAELPPFRHLALLRAEAAEEATPFQFLEQAHAVLPKEIASPTLTLVGPMPAPMARRAGRFRAQLLVSAQTRSCLNQFLSLWLPHVEQLPTSRRLRWSLDVDPMDLF